MERTPIAPAAPSAASEAALVEALKRGDEAAFARLVSEHGGRMLAVAKRIAPGEAEDVVQEAFLSAFKAIGGFDGRSQLGTWLHRITVNAALMRDRKRRARPVESIEPLLPQFEDGHHRDQPREWHGVTNEGERRIEAREAVARALAALPAEFRDVVLLREIEGLESKVVAERLGISDALVRQRLHRARQALVKLLDPTLSGGDR
jgi:RNA polymerase sigma-70 factor (ECF subfamily)